jgi:hypothetical protein
MRLFAIVVVLFVCGCGHPARSINEFEIRFERDLPGGPNTIVVDSDGAFTYEVPGESVGDTLTPAEITRLRALLEQPALAAVQARPEGGMRLQVTGDLTLDLRTKFPPGDAIGGLVTELQTISGRVLASRERPSTVIHFQRERDGLAPLVVIDVSLVPPVIAVTEHDGRHRTFAITQTTADELAAMLRDPALAVPPSHAADGLTDLLWFDSGDGTIQRRFAEPVPEGARKLITALGDLVAQHPPTPTPSDPDPSRGAAAGETCGTVQGIPCASGLVCDLRGSCTSSDAAGVCVPLVQSCPASGTPVCGCDGKQFRNDCERQLAHDMLDAAGACLR